MAAFYFENHKKKLYVLSVLAIVMDRIGSGKNCINFDAIALLKFALCGDVNS